MNILDRFEKTSKKKQGFLSNHEFKTNKSEVIYSKQAPIQLSCKFRRQNILLEILNQVKHSNQRFSQSKKKYKNKDKILDENILNVTKYSITDNKNKRSISRRPALRTQHF